MPSRSTSPVDTSSDRSRRRRRRTEARAKKRLDQPWATIAALIIAVLWTIPTFGLFISSFRPAADIQTTGWWTFFTNPQFTLENYVRRAAVRQRQR